MPTQPAPARAAVSGPRRILRALQNRNFRLFFGGQGISLIGTWMQQLAMSWLVYQLAREQEQQTGEHQGAAAFLMGLVGFAGQVPAFFLVPVAGVLIDRWNRHRLVIATQTLMMLQAAALAVFALLDLIDIPMLISLSLFLGCVNAFDMPARQSFLPDMLTNKEDLANAIALNSSLFHGARLVGPTLASLIIAFAGVDACFLLNALSYVAVIIALLRMDVPPRVRHTPHAPVLQGLREGLAYSFGFAPIRAILLLVAVFSFAGMPYTFLMPLYAGEILGGGEQGALVLGWLMTASGLGALTGAVYMASRQTVLGLGAKIVLGSVLFSTGLMVFSYSKVLALSLAMLAVTGFGLMVMMASCNTILQTIVDDDKRGRVMSIYTLSFMGLAPFGILLAGAVASEVGAPLTLLLCGACCLAASAVFGMRLGVLRRLVRPIYVQRGILPEASSGLQPVSDLLKTSEVKAPAGVVPSSPLAPRGREVGGEGDGQSAPSSSGPLPRGARGVNDER
jgi:MFS family permease